MANCDIVCIGQQALKQTFAGVIRQQDVRATEIDKVEMAKCYRPGDIVRAEVLALGDARSFQLTTAKDEYGVVYAKCAVSGQAMVPSSATEMACPESRVVEARKVAQS
ncbi:unnamed protein product [Pedinophyceae sp. YPF-701]|nr:unnamed protein product [Pedinophyceae sp. YPF-701]